MIREFTSFGKQAVALSFQGSWKFYLWMATLTVLVVIGGNAYMRQFVHGLATTGMTDQVAWGVYIGNFTFLVGVAAAAVMLVIPAYVYRVREMHDVVIFGELMSLTALIMALAFIMVDLGNPLLGWHMIPGIGILNFPSSLLAWDTIVLSGYLALNFYICAYFLYSKYVGRKPTWVFFVPFVFISIAWAVSIHTVTAFIYVGLVGRPFWNVSIMSPRFLVSAFVSGPAVLIIVFQVIRRITAYEISDRALQILRQIVTVSLLINLFILGSELFTEFYSGSLHNISTRYLFLGVEHHGEMKNSLVPVIWAATIVEIIAAIILITPLHSKVALLNIACAFSIWGVWVEKGIGMVVPGFIPTPLGDIVEYVPSLNETLVCMGIWAFGALVYTWLLKLAIPILTGELHRKESPERSHVV